MVCSDTDVMFQFCLPYISYDTGPVLHNHCFWFVAVPVVPSQESLESDELPQPTTLPFSSVSGENKEPADSSAKLPLTATMSTGFSEMMSSRNTTPPVSDAAGSTPTAASLTGGKEEKKRAEKPSTPDITKGGWSEVLLRSLELVI